MCATKVFILDPGMRAHMRPKSFRQSDATLNRLVVTRMPATGDIGRADPAHENGGARDRFAFAQVAIQIKRSALLLHIGMSLVPRGGIAPARKCLQGRPFQASGTLRPLVHPAS